MAIRLLQVEVVLFTGKGHLHRKLFPGVMWDGMFILHSSALRLIANPNVRPALLAHFKQSRVLKKWVNAICVKQENSRTYLVPVPA